MTSTRAFIDKINEAFAKGDTAYLLANVTDDIRWTMVGTPPVEGKEAFAEAMEAMASENVPEIRVTNVITHGASAVVEGTMTVRNGADVVKSYVFCDIYRLSGVKNAKIKEMTSYVLETAVQEDELRQLQGI